MDPLCAVLHRRVTRSVSESGLRARVVRRLRQSPRAHTARVHDGDELSRSDDAKTSGVCIAYVDGYTNLQKNIDWT